MNPRLRLALKVIGVNAGLVALVAVAAELVFGWWVFGPKFGILNIPRNEVRHYDTTGLHAGGGKVLYVRDGFGLRGPYEDVSMIDILTIGGSTTNERLLNEEETWTGALRANFAAAGIPRAVVNAGVEGQSTIGHLRSFELWFPLIPNLKPRLVVAYTGVNDVALDKAAYYDDMHPKDWWRKVRYFFLNNSALYHFHRTLRGWARAGDARLIHGTGLAQGIDWVEAPNQPRPENRAAKYRDRLAAYAQRVTLLAERIRALGAKPVFVTQPRFDHRVRDGKIHVPRNVGADFALESYVAITLFNRTLMETCTHVGAVCLDLAREVVFEDGDFYDFVHTTPKGSRKIGDYLFPKLGPHL